MDKRGAPPEVAIAKISALQAILVALITAVSTYFVTIATVKKAPQPEVVTPAAAERQVERPGRLAFESVQLSYRPDATAGNPWLRPLAVELERSADSSSTSFAVVVGKTGKMPSAPAFDMEFPPDIYIANSGFCFLVTKEAGLDRFTPLKSSFTGKATQVHVPAFRSEGYLLFVIRVKPELLALGRIKSIFFEVH